MPESLSRTPSGEGSANEQLYRLYREIATLAEEQRETRGGRQFTRDEVIGLTRAAAARVGMSHDRSFAEGLSTLIYSRVIDGIHRQMQAGHVRQSPAESAEVANAPR